MINRIFALVCCLCLSTVSFAQGGKIVKQTLQAATKDAAAQAGKKVLSSGVETAAKSAVTKAAGQALTAGTHNVLQNVPQTAASVNVQANTFIKQPQKPAFDEQKFLQKVGTAMDFTKTKKVLNYSTLLEEERAQARRLANLLKNYQTLNLDEIRENELWDGLDSLVVNQSLHRFLSKSIENRNYIQFMRDLSNYYSLSLEFMSSYELRFIASQDVREVFARTALEYMKAHPHKLNLKLREIMKSPYVDENVKSTLRSFIALEQIMPQHESGFLTVLRAAHKQHTAGLAAARSQQDIVTTVEAYKELAAELEEFTTQYHRAPRWNAQLPERRLYNRVLMLIAYNQANQFKQVLPYIDQIITLLGKYPSIGLTANETLEKVRAFTQANGHLPRQMSEIKDGEVVSDEELHLYESMVYWSTVSKDFAKQIVALHATAHLH